MGILSSIKKLFRPSDNEQDKTTIKNAVVEYINDHPEVIDEIVAQKIAERTAVIDKQAFEKHLVEVPPDNTLHQEPVSEKEEAHNEPEEPIEEAQPVSKASEPELSEEQERFFRYLETTNDNYFVTGKAGTGKSVLLRYFVKHTEKKTVVLAPTGIAAINANGQTIHSFFGLDFGLQNPADSKSVYKGLNENKISLLLKIDTILIDEVSMVRADTLNMIDAKLKAARKNKEPFGGCQMIFFGDLFQLPPVGEKDELAQQYLSKMYHTDFFFGAPVIRRYPCKILELTRVFRQTDGLFIDALNEIREGKADEECLNFINQRVSTKYPDQVIIVTPTNAAANRINQEKLAALPSKEYELRGRITGRFSEKECPTDIVLKLKVGAQVMMLKNHSERKWVNGTLAILSKITDNAIYVTINGVELEVDKETWSKFEYYFDEEDQKLEKREIGSFEQYPIRLAYAITIHKSQGQTYDSVVVDYSDSSAFAAGQTYVALSRCRSFDGLYLPKPITPKDIKVNQEIVDYIANQTVIR